MEILRISCIYKFRAAITDRRFMTMKLILKMIKLIVTHFRKTREVKKRDEEKEECGMKEKKIKDKGRRVVGRREDRTMREGNVKVLRG